MVDTMEYIRLKCNCMPNELLITECIGDRLWSDQVESFQTKTAGCPVCLHCYSNTLRAMYTDYPKYYFEPKTKPIMAGLFDLMTILFLGLKLSCCVSPLKVLKNECTSKVNNFQ